jgi:hypothetical protein
VYLQGTKSSSFAEEKEVLVIIEILKCTEETRLPDDPECADREAINEWINTKKAFFKVLNNKMDFDNINNEKDLPIR